MDEKRDAAKNEGEGSRSADERYRERTQEYLRKGSVEEDASRAAADVERTPEEYRRAEEEGKRRSAGDLPEDLSATD
jgi:hypothetical protein